MIQNCLIFFQKLDDIQKNFIPNNDTFLPCILLCRLAHSASEQHLEALECYKRALELDPSNASYQQNIEIAEQKVRETVKYLIVVTKMCMEINLAILGC